ncbi:MAG: hypothetical protein ABR606_15565 [Vicinamibacterales bacterium]
MPLLREMPLYVMNANHQIDSSANDVARVAWVETGPRFEGIEGLRQDRGDNGFCTLTLQTNEVELRYVDWRLRTRKEVVLRRRGDRIE